VVLTLFILLFVGQLGTHITNRDPLFYGPVVLPGLRLYDALAMLLAIFLQFVPFLLARKVLSSTEGQKLTLIVLAIAGATYAFLALYEVRMSPQLNRTIYGFFPHDWTQHRRSGGWRPIVFLHHGLQLGIFMAMAVIASAVMISASSAKTRILWIGLTCWLFFTLVMAKVLGALLITTVLLGAYYVLPKRLQIVFIVSVAACILLYPVVRAANLLPYQQLLSHVDAQRALSLSFRLENEQLLLDKALERPLFGWGGWGRSRVFSETGADIATTDGAWVIWLGLGGWLKYISTFGLLSWGILQLFWQRGKEIDVVTIGLALALTANLVDLIPNAGISPVTWLLAGALCGRLEYATAAKPEGAVVAETDPVLKRSGPVYSRDLQSVHTGTARSAPKVERDSTPYRRNLKKAD
jgi:hypothetical protein